MKIVLECFRCGDQARPENIFGTCSWRQGKQYHHWKAYKWDGKFWYKNGEMIKDYVLEMREAKQEGGDLNG